MFLRYAFYVIDGLCTIERRAENVQKYLFIEERGKNRDQFDIQGVLGG